MRYGSRPGKILPEAYYFAMLRRLPRAGKTQRAQLCMSSSAITLDQLTAILVEVILPEPPVVALFGPERRGARKGAPAAARRSEPLCASTVPHRTRDVGASGGISFNRSNRFVDFRFCVMLSW